MALTFQDVTLDTRTVSVVEVGVDQWIQEAALAEIDKQWLEAALAVATLADYTIPTIGVTADVYFAPFIKTTAQLTESFAKARIAVRPVAAVYQLEQDLATATAEPEA